MQDLLHFDVGHVVHKDLVSSIIEEAAVKGVGQVLYQVVVTDGILRGGVWRKSVYPFFDWKQEMDKFPQE